MPPRSRKTAQPETETEEAAVAETAEDAADTLPEAPAEPQESDGPGSPGDEVAAPDGEKTPERSDLQKTEQPCPECMPNGWPDGAFSVGCTHGTWVRDHA